MKKSSKQKKNKQKQQKQQRHSANQPQIPEIMAEGAEQQVQPVGGVDPTPPTPTDAAEQESEEAGSDTPANQSAPLTLAAIVEQKAALLNRNQQRAQWNQQRKAGKMVGAHVPKRFNRGG
ncbi:MAG: hypothetical protein R3C14_05080 [Caldilineaceae bacterium]